MDLALNMIDVVSAVGMETPETASCMVALIFCNISGQVGVNPTSVVKVLYRQMDDCVGHSNAAVSGYYDVVVIPARASRITILEKTPSPSITLALSYSSGASIFNGDNKIGPVAQTKTAAGSFFTYNRPGSTVENINSAGPINQPLTLRIRYDRSHGINPGVVYSYDLPKSILVKEETHGWVARRTTCSATCGDGQLCCRHNNYGQFCNLVSIGKILTELRCARRSSGIEVDDSRCLGLPNPPRPKERCNAGNCLGRARSVMQSFLSASSFL